MAQWADEALVCQCAQVSRGELTSAIAAGAASVRALCDATGAGSVCGSCRPLLAQLTGEAPAPTRPDGVVVTGASSIVAIAGFAAALLVPPWPIARSVSHVGHTVEVLWRSSFWKQVSGYAVLGTLALSMVLSARKRLRWFRWGTYGSFRALHTMLGGVALAGLAVHTGMRLGSNLNLALMAVFLGASLFGGLAGVAASLEASGVPTLAR